MLKYLFYKICFLCFLVLCCALCVPVCSFSKAQETSVAENEVQLFEDEPLKNIKITEGDLSEIPKEVTIKEVKTYFVVSAENSMIMAVNADICYNENKNHKGGLLAKYIKINEIRKEGTKISELIKNKETQLVSKIEKDKETFATGSFFAVVNKNEVFFFALNITETDISSSLSEGNQKLELKFVMGKTSTDKMTEPGNKIVWSIKTVTLENDIDFITELKTKLSDLKTLDFFVFITHDDKIELVIKETNNKKNEKKKFFFFKFETLDTELKLSYVKKMEDCPSSFFQWDEKLVMIPTECPEGSGKVRWATEIKDWDDVVGPFSHLWRILKDMRDFTSTVIDDKKVLLFTQKVDKDKNVILFMSDGNRVKKLGVIAADVEDNCPIRIVITDKDLFFLYQKPKNGDIKNIKLADYNEHIKTITDTLNAWNKTDKIISKLCVNKVNKESLCPTKFSTDGLVGFLSGYEGDSSIWEDKYLYMDVEVKNGEKINNGFRFSRDDAKAVWAVGSPTNNIPYNFVNFGFTLVATVKFEELTNENKQLSVMGVTTGKNGKSVGFFCQDKNMFALDVNIKMSLDDALNKKCVVGKQYQMALVYNDNKVFLYANWELFGNGQDFIIEKNSENNLQFYFGAYSDEEKTKIDAAHMTVTNVLLYNRPFLKNEIEEFKKNNKDDDTADLLPTNDEKNIHQHNSGNDNSGQKTAGINLDGTDMPLDTLTTQINTKENEMLRSENSAINFSIYVNVITLSLLFIGVFTFAGHYM